MTLHGLIAHFSWAMSPIPLGAWTTIYPFIYQRAILDCSQIAFLVAVLINLFFNWRIIALQIFLVFCQTSAWISHRYACIPSLLNLHPISLHHPTPLGWHRAPIWLSWAIPQIPIGSSFYIWWWKFPCYSLHTSHPLLPSPPAHKSILYVCFSIVGL